MKLLYCTLCKDIIAPHREKRMPRACNCGEYVVWWEDPDAGDIRVHSQSDHREYATIIGLHNSMLDVERCPSFSEIRAMANGVTLGSNSSMFTKAESLFIRYRPGTTDDSKWAKKVPST